MGEGSSFGRASRTRAPRIRRSIHLPELGELRERVELLEDAQQDLQNQLIAKRAEVTRLKRDRNERRLTDPLMP